MHRKIAFVCAILFFGTIAVYWQTTDFSFTVYDDDEYVYNNPIVTSGVTMAGIRAAFTREHAANYHPLTWLSHMLDVELFGMDAGRHHLVNVLLHAANAVLLFLLLWLFTEAFWPAVVVAFLFALHPLHVESVAWVSERKDVLSTLFGLLTILAYGHAVAHGHRPAMIAAVVLYGCSLLAKPMLVTLPLLLLLLDYWPQARLTAATWKRVVVEKWPFVVLAICSSLLTLWAQDKGGAIQSMVHYPLTVRLANGLVAYMLYLAKMVWPVGLAVIYPHKGAALPGWQVGTAALLLLTVSVVCWRQRQQRPWLLGGWLWYLVSLLPVLGIVQVGYQAIADRYTYIPLIGPFIIIAYLFCRCVAGVTLAARKWLAGGMVVVLLLLTIVTERQIGYWHDSYTLFNRALAVTEENYVAHNHLGIAYIRDNKLSQAATHFQKTVAIKPDHYAAWSNLGTLYLRRQQYDQAAKCFQKAIAIKEDFATAVNNYGLVLYMKQQYDDAIGQFRRAVELEDDKAEFIDNLGGAYLAKGADDEAQHCFERAIAMNPKFAGAYLDLGTVYLNRGDWQRAIRNFQTALGLEPHLQAARDGLLQAQEMRRNGR